MKAERWHPLAGYAALLAVILLPFLPHTNRWLYDARTVSGAVDDKVAEVLLVYSGAVWQMWEAIQGNGSAVGADEAMNPLPLILLTAAQGVLPDIAATNLVLWLAWLGAAGAAYLLCRQATGDAPGARAGAFAGGALFALGPWTTEMMRSRSLDHGLVGLVPLFLWALCRALRAPSPGKAMVAGLCAVTLSASNFYLLLAALVMACVLVPAELWTQRTALRERAVALVAAGAIGLALSWPLISAQHASLSRIEPRFRQMMQLQPGERYANAWELATALQVDSVATIAWLGALLALFQWRKRAPEVTPWVASAMVGATFVGLTALSNPVGARLAQLPILWRARRPETFWVIPVLSISVLVALGIARATRSKGRAVIATALTLVGTLLLPASTGQPTTLPDPILQAIADHSGRVAVQGDSPASSRLLGFHALQWVNRPQDLDTVAISNSGRSPMKATLYRFASDECGLWVREQTPAGHPDSLTAVATASGWVALTGTRCTQ
jgi:hypothetical protein